MLAIVTNGTINHQHHTISCIATSVFAPVLPSPIIHVLKIPHHWGNQRYRYCYSQTSSGVRPDRDEFEAILVVATRASQETPEGRI
eukprot:3948604-Pyramimonas_sp.AAC.1